MENWHVRHMDAEDKDLIAQVLLSKKVTKLPPAALSGNEMSKSTQEHIAKERRKFRAVKRQK